jgi:hypothetical protein
MTIEKRDKPGMPPADRGLLSEREAAEYLGLSKSGFRSLVKSGVVSRVELANLRRNLYRRENLAALVTTLPTTHTTRPRPAPARPW